MLQLRDKRYNDVRMVFNEEAHSYTDTMGNKYRSMTTILGDYKEKFNKAYWLPKKAKELGISQKRLEAQWNTITTEACDRGTKIHDGIENGVKGVSMFKDAVQHLKRHSGDMITVADLPILDKQIKQLDLIEFINLTHGKYPEIYKVLEWYVARGYRIYAEIGAFLIDYLISGMIDLLLISDYDFWVGDWKTNRGGLIFSSGYYKKDKKQTPHQLTNEWVHKEETLLAPVNNLPACNGSTYGLQLSGYATMVQMILGIPCRGLWLAHIDCDFVLNEYGQPKKFSDGLYHIKDNPVEKVTMHKIPFYQNEFKAILDDRRRVVEASRVPITLF